MTTGNACFRVAAAMLVSGLSTWSATAHAGVAEPNGLAVPQPISGDAPYQTSAGSLTLQGLFASRNEQIDWQLDASNSPSVFSPLCGFTGTLVLRGGGCKVDFGWYNVDPSNVPPTDAQIYTLVPKTDPIFNQSFHPQAGEAGQTFTAAAIQTDPNYKGGSIGFAFKGNPSEVCSQTHYSQQPLNVTCTSCSPPAAWITTLIYKSTATPSAYYLAFEDLPMSPTNFQGFPGQVATNDGDFNDFVYFITGIDCQGAGKPCETDQLGACKSGLTDCSAGMQVTCQSQTKPSPEKCDGIDNDCNGATDEGSLCASNEVCDRGTCVKSCGSGEFPCNAGFVCKAGYCVEASCETVSCPEGKVCHNGVCAGPCDGVTCPQAQVCNAGVGKCGDPCVGVTCAANRVCDGGVCVSACTCKGCDAGYVCNQGSGQCVEPGCESKMCPTGTVCAAGACVDACQGVMCPNGAACQDGQCGDPSMGTSTGVGAGGAGGTSFVGSGGSTVTGAGDMTTAGGTGAGGEGGLGTKPLPAAGPRCLCSFGDEAPPDLAAAASGLLLLALGRRRGRRHHRA